MPRNLPEVSYISRLDTFRAVAALLVVECHYVLLPSRYLNLASVGVWFFFVLSGFLITWLLLNDRAAGHGSVLRRFYIRRAFRIFPLYYLALCVGVALDIPDFRHSIAWTAPYLTNVYSLIDSNASLAYAGHFWSLAVEEQFYLAWPALVVLGGRRAWMVAAALIPVAIAYKYVSYLHGGYPRFAVSPLSCADALSIGALSAIACERFGIIRIEMFLRSCLVASVPALILFVSPVPPLSLAFSGVGAALFFAWLAVLAVKDGPGGNSWGGTWLPALGKISYGIYVYHYMVRGLMNLWVVDPSWWSRLGGVAASILVSWLSWHYFEQPIRRFGYDLARRVPSAVTVRSESVTAL